MVGILALVVFVYQPYPAEFCSVLDLHLPLQAFPNGIYKRPLSCSCSKNVFPACDTFARQTAVNSQQVKFFKKILSSAKHSQRYVKFSIKLKGTR